jgi:4-aminobutyrate aminotransferase-like enzyme
MAIAGGAGSYFWDFTGKKYLDFSCQLVFTNIGHQHPKSSPPLKSKQIFSPQLRHNMPMRRAMKQQSGFLKYLVITLKRSSLQMLGQMELKTQ